MVWLVAGIAFAIFVLSVLRWAAYASPKDIKKAVFGIALVIALIVGVLTLFLGRVGMSAPLLVGAFALWRRYQRLAGYAALGKRFANWLGLTPTSETSSSGAGSSGQETIVETEYLTMVLDQSTGHLAGRIKSGAYAGRTLETLTRSELIDLYRQLGQRDVESERLVEAYLDRYHPRWGEYAHRDHQDKETSAGGKTGQMSRADAAAVLGIPDDADEEQIQQAYTRAMKAAHPDQGGNNELAAKINRARDLLLGN
ncbi:MAG: DnaJ domain-containing protein [Pseudomonadota bacterium]